MTFEFRLDDLIELVSIRKLLDKNPRKAKRELTNFIKDLRERMEKEMEKNEGYERRKR